MKLIELIHSQGPTTKVVPDIDLEQDTIDFIKNFLDPTQPIHPKHIQSFLTSPNVAKPFLFDILNQIVETLYSFQSEAINLIELFKKNPNKSAISIDPNDKEKYRRLYIFYALYVTNPELKPSIELRQNLPLLMNILYELGQLQEMDISPLRLEISKPFREPGERIQKRPISPRKDILDTESTRPIAQSQGVKNITYLAIQNGKTIHIRMPAPQLPHQIEVSKSVGLLASRIAKRVSQKHFALERLTSNGLVYSRTLPSHEFQLNENPEENTQLRAKAIPSGLGIIDETCNYICEQDANLGNLALSDERLDARTYLSKIDFDRCNMHHNFVRTPAPREQIQESYESFSTKGTFKQRIYGSIEKPDELYELERLQTRLKLALFTPELIELDASKCYLEEEKGEKEALQKVLAFLPRLNLEVLDKIADEKERIQQLVKQRKIKLDDIYLDVINYFLKYDSKNLTAQQSSVVLKSIQNKVLEVSRLIYDGPKKQAKFQKRIEGYTKKNSYVGSMLSVTFGLSTGTVGVLGIVGLTNLWNPLGWTLIGLGIAGILAGGISAAVKAIQASYIHKRVFKPRPSSKPSNPPSQSLQATKPPSSTGHLFDKHGLIPQPETVPKAVPNSIKSMTYTQVQYDLAPIRQESITSRAVKPKNCSR